MPYKKIRLNLETDWARSVYEDFAWSYISEEEAANTFDPNVQIRYAVDAEELRNLLDGEEHLPSSLTHYNKEIGRWRFKCIRRLKHPAVTDIEAHTLTSVLDLVRTYGNLFIDPGLLRQLFEDLDAKHVTPLTDEYLARPSPSPKFPYMKLERDPQRARTMRTRNIRAAERLAKKRAEHEEKVRRRRAEDERENVRSTKASKRLEFLAPMLKVLYDRVEHVVSQRFERVLTLRATRQAPNEYTAVRGLTELVETAHELGIPYGSMFAPAAKDEPNVVLTGPEMDGLKKLPTQYVGLFSVYRDVPRFRNEFSHVSSGVDNRDPKVYEDVLNEISQELIDRYARFYTLLKKAMRAQRRSHA